ncbi:MAG TPA: hypothetical protein EYN17_01390, partial [Candidatus Poseidoniales archaeon]|nr:hypothetical protein [Candidatus Poseidoniales archaeon]
ADLTDASFYLAFLNGADLYAADCTDAYFSYAAISGANFNSTDLKFADFTGATGTTGATFSNSYWHQTEWTDGVKYDSNQG